MFVNTLMMSRCMSAETSVPLRNERKRETARRARRIFEEVMKMKVKLVQRRKSPAGRKAAALLLALALGGTGSAFGAWV